MLAGIFFYFITQGTGEALSPKTIILEQEQSAPTPYQSIDKLMQQLERLKKTTSDPVVKERISWLQSLQSRVKRALFSAGTVNDMEKILKEYEKFNAAASPDSGWAGVAFRILMHYPNETEWNQYYFKRGTFKDLLERVKILEETFQWIGTNKEQNYSPKELRILLYRDYEISVNLVVAFNIGIKHPSAERQLGFYSRPAYYNETNQIILGHNLVPFEFAASRNTRNIHVSRPVAGAFRGTIKKDLSRAGATFALNVPSEIADETKSLVDDVRQELWENFWVVAKALAEMPAVHPETEMHLISGRWKEILGEEHPLVQTPMRWDEFRGIVLRHLGRKPMDLTATENFL